MGLKLILKDVEVASSSIATRKVWASKDPNAKPEDPSRARFELVVRVAKGTLAHRDLLHALETVMTGTPVEDLRPSLARQKAAEHPKLGDIALVEMCDVTSLKVKNAQTLRDPDGPKSQRGKLSSWADGILAPGDFLLTTRARNRPQCIDENARRYDGEVHGCIVDVHCDLWVRKNTQNPGISFEVEGVRIISRTEKAAVDVFGLGSGDIAYDYLPPDLVGAGEAIGKAHEAEVPRSVEREPAPKVVAPKMDAFDW